MITCALLSKWHVHAGDYAKQAMANKELKIVAVWDEDAVRGEAWAKELNVPFRAELESVLTDQTIQAVIVDTPTNLHKDVITRAAKHGKHIFTEKVLAFTVHDCEEILTAIDRAGIRFMISLPRLVDPTYLYAEKAIAKGWLGEVNYVRCRLAHNGGLPYEGHPSGWLPGHFFDPVACGGGALIDLGAHPIYLTNRLAGQALAVSAHFLTTLGHQVEDQAVVLVDYQSGALGVIEAGFTSGASPFLLEVHGTKGSILVEDSTLRIKSQPLGATAWITPELPERISSPMEQWVQAILTGAPTTITHDDALRLTQINQAAALSHQKGQKVNIASL